MFKKLLSCVNIFAFLGKIKHLKVMDVPKAIIGFILNRIAGTKTWLLLRFLSRIVIDGTEYDIAGQSGNVYNAITKSGGKVEFSKKDIKDVVKATLRKCAEPINLLGESVNLVGIKINISKDIFIPKPTNLVRESRKFLKLVFTTKK